jgi:hypothetical protein
MPHPLSEKLSWRDVEAQRLALPRPISRAEFARRSGVSESTITKGLAEDRSVRSGIRQQVRLVLEAAARADAGT